MLNLPEMRKTVRLALGAQENEFDDKDVDRALKLCLNEAQRLVRFHRETTVVTLISGNAGFTVADSTFRPERLFESEIGYVNRNVWATATSYSVRDLVQGNGTPDAYLYACTVAHTSDSTNTPPNGSYWKQVRWDRGDPVAQIGFGLMRDYLTSGLPVRGGPTPQILGSSGQPQFIAWAPDGKGYVYPVPDEAYPLNLTYALPLPDWTPGTKAVIDVEIPEEYLYPMLWFGAPAALMYPTRGDRDADAGWQRFMAAIQSNIGANDPDRGPAYMNPDKY